MLVRFILDARKCTYLPGTKAHTQYSRHHFELCDVIEDVKWCCAMDKDLVIFGLWSLVFEIDKWMRSLGLCVNARGWREMIYRGNCTANINPSGSCGFLRHRENDWLPYVTSVLPSRQIRAGSGVTQALEAVYPCFQVLRTSAGCQRSAQRVQWLPCMGFE
jgi:hypothetical protein